MTASNLRTTILTRLASAGNTYLDLAEGTGVISSASVPPDRMTALDAAWRTIEKIISQADDASPINIKGRTATRRVDAILKQVADGKITPREARAHMDLISAGVDIKELPKLVAALEKANA